MIYYAQCKCCQAKWKLVPPQGALDLVSALEVMKAGICPQCDNDGQRGPINWRFQFGGDQEPHYGQVRPRRETA